MRGPAPAGETRTPSAQGQGSGQTGMRAEAPRARPRAAFSPVCPRHEMARTDGHRTRAPSRSTESDEVAPTPRVDLRARTRRVRKWGERRAGPDIRRGVVVGIAPSRSADDAEMAPTPIRGP